MKGFGVCVFVFRELVVLATKQLKPCHLLLQANCLALNEFNILYEIAIAINSPDRIRMP